MNNFIIFTTYYVLILLSIIGYGLYFLKILKIKLDFINFGYAGLFGIYILIIYSYFSNLFIAHSVTHNLIVLFIGLILFFYSMKKNIFYTKVKLLFLL